MSTNKIEKVILGDCLEVLPTIPDESIDLLVTDPPYLISYTTNRRKNKSHRFCSAIQGDDDFELLSKYIQESYRVLKNNSAGYIFCSSKHVDFFKQEIENYFTIKNMIIWVKNSWTAGDLTAQFGQQYEIIFLVNKGRKPFYGKRLTDIRFADRVAGKTQLHQNQKPIALLEQLILSHSLPGDVILDAFAGSGSTGVACRNLGRSFILIEKEEAYYNIIQKRLFERECNDY